MTHLCTKLQLPPVKPHTLRLALSLPTLRASSAAVCRRSAAPRSVRPHNLQLEETGILVLSLSVCVFVEMERSPETTSWFQFKVTLSGDHMTGGAVTLKAGGSLALKCLWLSALTQLMTTNLHAGVQSQKHPTV